MRKYIAPIAVALTAFVAAAALAEPVSYENLARFLKGGVYIGSNTPASSNNKITKTVASGAITYDCADTLTATCTDSGAQTVTGAAVGDTCSIGPNATAAALSGTWTCYVSAADAVKIKFCNPTAGSINPASGSFRVRTFSNQ